MGASVKKKNSDSIVVLNIDKRATRRDQQTVSQARSAHKAAEMIHNPNRASLLDLMEDCMIDPFLSGVVGKRFRMMRNKRLRLYDKEGEVLEHMDDVIQSKAFRRLRKTRYYGDMFGVNGVEFMAKQVAEMYNVRNVIYLPDSNLGFTPIPRKHIKPDIGKVVYNQYGRDGDDYVNDPFLWVLESDEDDNNFGLLLKAIPYVLFKRHGFVNWSGYVEKFGQPILMGKYKAHDEKTRVILQKAIDDAAEDFGLVIPEEANIDTLDGKQTNASGDLHNNFKNACDEQMAILLLGVTETTKSSDSSGYAQSDTHQSQQYSITQDDMDSEAEAFNEEKFLNILRAAGYNIPPGAKFDHEEDADLAFMSSKLEIDLKIKNAGIPIDDAHFYDTYGVPMPKETQEEDVEDEEQKKKPPTGKKTDDVEEEDDDNKPPTGKKPEKKKGKGAIAMLKDFFVEASASPGHLTANLYNSTCAVCGGVHHAPQAVANDGIKKIAEDVAGQLYDGQIKEGYIDDAIYTHTANKLMEAVFEGMGQNSFSYDDVNNELAAYLQQNIHAFSAAKTLVELEHFRDLMVGDDGKIISRSQYINRVFDEGYRFNKTYLETEYNTAYSSAQTAVEFNDFGDDAAIQISTVGDDRVRPQHQILDGFTALKSDNIWKKLCPPFDFNCRCRLIPGIASNIDGTKKPGLVTRAGISKHFQRNTATDMVIYKDSHPYFKGARPTLKELTAMKNYNMPSVQKLYINNDFAPAKKLATRREANEWWTNKAGVDRGHFDVQDKTGISIRFDNRFRVHVSEHNQEVRFKYLPNVEDIIAAPDEIWGFKEAGTLRKVYIKYFEDAPHAVRVEGVDAKTYWRFEQDGKINLQSLTMARRGALIYRK